MKTKNDLTKLLLFMGMFLAVFAIAKLDTTTISFAKNERSYLMLLFSVIFIIISFFRIRREKKQ